MLLAIESSTDILSVAMLRGDDVVALHQQDGPRQHAASLLPAIDRVLSETGIGLERLNAIGVSIGPGSFTSLRIGLATVKGLAFGRSLAVAGVSTLEAMALGYFETHPEAGDCEVVALLDARRGEWYAGSWTRPAGGDGRLALGLPEGLYSPEPLAIRLGGRAAEGAAGQRAGRTVAICPEAEGWARRFEDAEWRVCEILSGAAARPRADRVGRLAQAAVARGEQIDARELAARYLRRAEAEAKRLGGPVEAGEVARVEERPA
jgi:tRNA threonylcarbamoyladenosine biosynthesis protein TsaB